MVNVRQSSLRFLFIWIGDNRRTTNINVIRRIDRGRTVEHLANRLVPPDFPFRHERLDQVLEENAFAIRHVEKVIGRNHWRRINNSSRVLAPEQQAGDAIDRVKMTITRTNVEETFVIEGGRGIDPEAHTSDAAEPWLVTPNPVTCERKRVDGVGPIGHIDTPLPFVENRGRSDFSSEKS